MNQPKEQDPRAVAPVLAGILGLAEPGMASPVLVRPSPPTIGELAGEAAGGAFTGLRLTAADLLKRLSEATAPVEKSLVTGEAPEAPETGLIGVLGKAEEALGKPSELIGKAAEKIRPKEMPKTTAGRLGMMGEQIVEIAALGSPVGRTLARAFAPRSLIEAAEAGKTVAKLAYGAFRGAGLGATLGALHAEKPQDVAKEAAVWASLEGASAAGRRIAGAIAGAMTSLLVDQATDKEPDLERAAFVGGAAFLLPSLRGVFERVLRRGKMTVDDVAEIGKVSATKDAEILEQYRNFLKQFGADARRWDAKAVTEWINNNVDPDYRQQMMELVAQRKVRKIKARARAKTTEKPPEQPRKPESIDDLAEGMRIRYRGQEGTVQTVHGKMVTIDLAGTKKRVRWQSLEILPGEEKAATAPETTSAEVPTGLQQDLRRAAEDAYATYRQFGPERAYRRSGELLDELRAKYGEKVTESDLAREIRRVSERPPEPVAALAQGEKGKALPIKKPPVEAGPPKRPLLEEMARMREAPEKRVIEGRQLPPAKPPERKVVVPQVIERVDVPGLGSYGVTRLERPALPPPPEGPRAVGKRPPKPLTIARYLAHQVKPSEKKYFPDLPWWIFAKKGKGMALDELAMDLDAEGAFGSRYYFRETGQNGSDVLYRAIKEGWIHATDPHNQKYAAYFDWLREEREMYEVPEFRDAMDASIPRSLNGIEEYYANYYASLSPQVRPYVVGELIRRAKDADPRVSEERLRRLMGQKALQADKNANEFRKSDLGKKSGAELGVAKWADEAPFAVFVGIKRDDDGKLTVDTNRAALGLALGLAAARILKSKANGDRVDAKAFERLEKKIMSQPETKPAYADGTHQPGDEGSWPRLWGTFEKIMPKRHTMLALDKWFPGTYENVYMRLERVRAYTRQLIYEETLKLRKVVRKELGKALPGEDVKRRIFYYLDGQAPVETLKPAKDAKPVGTTMLSMRTPAVWDAETAEALAQKAGGTNIKVESAKWRGEPVFYANYELEVPIYEVKGTGEQAVAQYLRDRYDMLSALFGTKYVQNYQPRVSAEIDESLLKGLRGVYDAFGEKLPQDVRFFADYKRKVEEFLGARREDPFWLFVNYLTKGSRKLYNYELPEIQKFLNEMGGRVEPKIEEVVVRGEKKWRLRNPKTGKSLGTFSSKASAKRAWQRIQTVRKPTGVWERRGTNYDLLRNYTIDLVRDHLGYVDRTTREMSLFMSAFVHPIYRTMYALKGKSFDRAAELQAEIAATRAADLLVRYAYSGLLSHPISAVKNLTQQSHNIAILGFKTWLEAATKLFGTSSVRALGSAMLGKRPKLDLLEKTIEEMQKAGVKPAYAADIFTPTTFYRNTMETIRESSTLLFTMADTANRAVAWVGAGLKFDRALPKLKESTAAFEKASGIAYLDAPERLAIRKYLKAGKVADARRWFQRSIVADTQYLYDKGNSPWMTRSSSGRLFFQFMSWPSNYLVFWGKMARTKNYQAMMRYVATMLAVGYLVKDKELFGKKLSVLSWMGFAPLMIMERGAYGDATIGLAPTPQFVLNWAYVLGHAGMAGEAVLLHDFDKASSEWKQLEKLTERQMLRAVETYVPAGRVLVDVGKQLKNRPKEVPKW